MVSQFNLFKPKYCNHSKQRDLEPEQIQKQARMGAYTRKCYGMVKSICGRFYILKKGINYPGQWKHYSRNIIISPIIDKVNKNTSFSLRGDVMVGWGGLIFGCIINTTFISHLVGDFWGLYYFPLSTDLSQFFLSVPLQWAAIYTRFSQNATFGSFPFVCTIFTLQLTYIHIYILRWHGRLSTSWRTILRTHSQYDSRLQFIASSSSICYQVQLLLHYSQIVIYTVYGFQPAFLGPNNAGTLVL